MQVSECHYLQIPSLLQGDSHYRLLLYCSRLLISLTHLPSIISIAGIILIILKSFLVFVFPYLKIFRDEIVLHKSYLFALPH